MEKKRTAKILLIGALLLAPALIVTKPAFIARAASSRPQDTAGVKEHQDWPADPIVCERRPHRPPRKSWPRTCLRSIYCPDQPTCRLQRFGDRRRPQSRDSPRAPW